MVTVTFFQKISLFVVRAIFRTFALVPFSVRSVLGFLVGFVFSFFPTRDRKIAKLQLSAFYNTRLPWWAVGSVYGHVGRIAFESLEIRPMLEKPEKRIVEEGLQDLLDRKTGTICLTAHTGNWDLLAAHVIQRGLKLATAGREARNPVLQALLQDLREKDGIETMWRSRGALHRRIKDFLQQGGTIAALIDQDTRVSGSHAPFFGRPAFTPTGLIELGRMNGASFISAFIFCTGLCRYEIFIEPIDSSLSAIEIAAEFNRRLEFHIRRHPFQWVWFHKRWRTMEDGTRLSSSEYIKMLNERLESEETFEEHKAGRFLNTILSALATLSILCSCTAGNSVRTPSHLEKATELARSGDADAAIAEYNAHIEYRLQVHDRPEWENPWFYLLLIGDLELQKGDLDAALQAYEEAEQKGVDKDLVSDRFRQAGTSLAENGKPREAIEILKKYRDRDPLLIDAMCDRLARKIVGDEDNPKEAPGE